MKYVKLFEQFNLDIDPYGEEDWGDERPKYKIMKKNYNRDLRWQNGDRYFLTTNGKNIILDFEFLKRGIHFNVPGKNLENLNKNKLLSGEYLK